MGVIFIVLGRHRPDRPGGPRPFPDAADPRRPDHGRAALPEDRLGPRHRPAASFDRARAWATATAASRAGRYARATARAPQGRRSRSRWSSSAPSRCWSRRAATWSLGPSALSLPDLDADVLLTALTVLVIPQLPLSFANSCLATADAARSYFGERAAHVRPGRLATSLGLRERARGRDERDARLPRGGRADRPPRVRRAHRGRAARHGPRAARRSPLAAGSGPRRRSSPRSRCRSWPALLAAAGVLHIGLARDLEGAPAWPLALLVAVTRLLAQPGGRAGGRARVVVDPAFPRSCAGYAGEMEGSEPSGRAAPPGRAH